MTDIEKLKKITALGKRREKIEGDIKKLIAEFKQLQKGSTTLRTKKAIAVRQVWRNAGNVNPDCWFR